MIWLFRRAAARWFAADGVGEWQARQRGFVPTGRRCADQRVGATAVEQPGLLVAENAAGTGMTTMSPLARSASTTEVAGAESQRQTANASGLQSWATRIRSRVRFPQAVLQRIRAGSRLPIHAGRKSAMQS